MSKRKFPHRSETTAVIEYKKKRSGQAIFLLPGVSGHWSQSGLHKQLADALFNTETVTQAYASYGCHERQLYINMKLLQCPRLAQTWIGHSEGAARILLACQQQRVQGKLKHVILVSPAWALRHFGPLNITQIVESMRGLQITLIETQFGFGSYEQNLREASFFRNFVRVYEHGTVVQISGSYHNLSASAAAKTALTTILRSIVTPKQPTSLTFFAETQEDNSTWDKLHATLRNFDVIFVGMRLGVSEKPTPGEQLQTAQAFGRGYYKKLSLLEKSVRVVGLAKRWQRPGPQRVSGNVEVDWVRTIFEQGSERRCAVWVQESHVRAMQNWLRLW